MAESPEYFRGFVHGMHFLLLALGGRLTARTLPREEVQKVLDEYARMVAEHRAQLEPARERPERHEQVLYGDEAPLR